MSDATSARERLIERAGAWHVVVDDVFETEGSLIAYARRGAHAEVLKIVKRPGDEWHSGDVLAAFDGRGVVRALEHVGGAILMERLSPGHSLVNLTLSDRDAEATSVIAGVIREMTSEPSVVSTSNGYPTVETWGKGFSRYAATRDQAISRDLVSEAQRTFEQLCRSQSNTRLLHGDLQHSNVLFDERRGWLAIDPKGVVGEVKYEVGAAVRNPREAPLLFAAPDALERRIRQYSSELQLDAARILGWAFAQAVLSAIWVIEDGGTLEQEEPTIALAETIRRMLPSFSRSLSQDLESRTEHRRIF